MKKIILWIMVVLVFILGWHFLYNREGSGGDIDQNLARYFQEQMIGIGVADIGQPIEGFDNNLLIMAFPGLVPEDFVEVKTVEGQYELEGGEVVFVRNDQMPVSSPERMVSDEGYATLLKNVSRRLNLSVTRPGDVDLLVDRINTDGN